MTSKRGAVFFPDAIKIRLWKFDEDTTVLHCGDVTIERPHDIHQDSSRDIRAWEATGWTKIKPLRRYSKLIFRALTIAPKL